MKTKRNDKMTLEEARELSELTTTIAANLKYIEEQRNDEELEEMLEKTSAVVQNLKRIDEAA